MILKIKQILNKWFFKKTTKIVLSCWDEKRLKNLTGREKEKLLNELYFKYGLKK
jgi:hypothetical protein